MKKHIIGLAIFSSIVFAATFVDGIFNVSDIAPVYEVISTPRYISTERTHCKFKIKNNQSAPEIKQAVYNVRTKQFNWELNAAPLTPRIALHFFFNEPNGIRYLNSISVSQLQFRNGMFKVATSSKWLDNLSSYQNVYVVPEYTSDEEFNSQNHQPEFDAANATAVTIDYGK